MKIAVIGGGAAGMVAAICAANEKNEVVILERNDRVGKKILATGNGRCNLGNEDMDISYYYSSDINKVDYVLQQMDVSKTISFFDKMGLLIKSKNGYLYPACEQASAVLDILRIQLKKRNVRIIPEAKVNMIKVLDSRGFELGFGNERLYFDKVIIAAGGKAAPKTGSDGSGYKLARQLGHTVTDTFPALVQLKCNDSFCKALAGIRAEGNISISDNKSLLTEEYGEIQFTDYGISGIPVFQLSGLVNQELRQVNQLQASIDFLPKYSADELKEQNAIRFANLQGVTVEEYFTGLLHKKLMSVMIKMAGLHPADIVGKITCKELEQVYLYCKQFIMHIDGSNSYDQAQVSRGGVVMSEVTNELESVLHKGLYFAGEVLDVDGRCGGYNLQWAWSSGFVAGNAAGR